jgi:hydrogenase maturation protein HypF
MLGPHIGDLDGLLATLAFERMVEDLQDLHGITPRLVACDRHPDYRTSHYAHRLGLPVCAVQHHVAHLAAVAAESQIMPPLHGAAWDGTGYGDDGTVWGGEFFAWPADGPVRRSASLLPFLLPGGEAAVREPRRTAVGLLAAARGPDAAEDVRFASVRAFAPADRRLLRGLLAGRRGGVQTSSIGRLFDAVASLLGLCHHNRFEGEAAMALEHAADPFPHDAPDYPFAWLDQDGLRLLDWRPLLDALLADQAAGAEPGDMAARFHSTLAAILVSYAADQQVDRMVLSGGCFQNRRLTEEAVRRLQDGGVRVYWPQRVPPGDGGLAVGQAAMAAAYQNQGE